MVRDLEYPVDTLRIANANLDMRVHVHASIWIDWVPLYKDAPYCIDWGQFVLCTYVMEHVEYSAVQPSRHEVFTVLRHFGQSFSGLERILKVLVGIFDLANASSG